MSEHKDGPLTFYTSYERDAHIAKVVEYCVQVAERQYMDRSQAETLVVDGYVSVDGQDVRSVGHVLASGTWQVNVRGKQHLVIVTPSAEA